MPGSFWQHYKRKTVYELIGIARSQIDENETDMVVYKSVDDGQLWVRPLDKFLEKVGDEPRFEKIKNYQP